MKMLSRILLTFGVQGAQIPEEPCSFCGSTRMKAKIQGYFWSIFISASRSNTDHY